MLQGVMLVWFILTGASFAFVVWDSATNGVTSWVQRIAWILVTIYTGPVGLFMYLLACRRPFPGGHDRYTAAIWKQGLNSEMHCLAGDATGIIIAASIVPVLALSNGWDLIIEYSAGFISGLFIFQALMMVRMYDGDYFKAVRKSFFAETVSMNFVMTGMIPTMVLLEAHWPDSEDPAQPAFWFRMSLASIVGGIIAFPVNFWLVKNHLKHGCMTLPGADGPAPDLGHRSPEAFNSGADHMMEMGGEMTEVLNDHEEMESMKEPQKMQGHNEVSDKNGMAMPELSIGTSLLWIAGTYLLLFGAVWLTALRVPLTFA